MIRPTLLLSAALLVGCDEPPPPEFHARKLFYHCTRHIEDEPNVRANAESGIAASIKACEEAAIRISGLEERKQ